jgi:hypothetical protein
MNHEHSESESHMNHSYEYTATISHPWSMNHEHSESENHESQLRGVYRYDIVSYLQSAKSDVEQNAVKTGRDIACETECRQNDDNAYRKEFRQKDDYCNQANTGQARASYPYENPEPWPGDACRKECRQKEVNQNQAGVVHPRSWWVSRRVLQEDSVPEMAVSTLKQAQ